MGGDSRTRVAGLALAGAGVLQLLALAFPLLRGQPALGTADTALVVQVPIGVILVAAGAFAVRRSEPFDLGLTVGVGAALAGRVVLLPMSLVGSGDRPASAWFLIVAASAFAAGGAAIMVTGAPAPAGRVPVGSVATATVLSAATFAFHPYEGVEIVITDRSWTTIGILAELVAVSAVPVFAARRGLFGAGMAGGAAAVLATWFVANIALDLGIGFGTWCAGAAVAALISLAFVLGREP